MILFSILTIILTIALILCVCIGGSMLAVFILVFSDVIVCIGMIILVTKHLFRKRK
jgi:hypothetical protein